MDFAFNEVDEDVDIFLEHFGIKGMQWGVRKQRRMKYRQAQFQRQRQREAIDPQRVKRLEENKIARGKAVRKEALRAGIKAGVIASVLGALFIAANLKLANPMKISDMHLSGETAKTAADFIRSEHATQLSSLTRMHTEGKMDAEQFANFSKILKARYDKKLVDAALDNFK